MTRLRAGLDIGGTKTHCVVVAADGRVVCEQIAPTSPGNAAVVATAVQAVREAAAEAGVAPSDLASLGVGIPGRVDPLTGVVRTAVNLGIAELQLGSALQQQLNVPVAIDNDVKAAAMGASRVFGERGTDLSYLNVGTGVAAATVSAGRLVRGVGNVAGEIGHIPVDPAGPVCDCGQRGCLEAIVGGRHLSTRLATIGVGLSELVTVARGGNAAATAELQRVVNGLVTGVLVLALAHGSPLILLGGGVLRHGDGLLAATLDALTERGGSSAFIASLQLPDRVELLPADRPIAAIGAAQIGRLATAATLL